jgi:hypothetical protein
MMISLLLLDRPVATRDLQAAVASSGFQAELLEWHRGLSALHLWDPNRAPRDAPGPRDVALALPPYPGRPSETWSTWELGEGSADLALARHVAATVSARVLVVLLHDQGGAIAVEVTSEGVAGLRHALYGDEGSGSWFPPGGSPPSRRRGGSRVSCRTRRRPRSPSCSTETPAGNRGSLSARRRPPIPGLSRRRRAARVPRRRPRASVRWPR